MTIEELKAELEKGVKYFLLNPRELARLYRNIYGQASFCYSCEKVLIAKYNELNNVHTMPGKYRMKCGHVIRFKDEHITCKNLTDDIAVELISLGWSNLIYET